MPNTMQIQYSAQYVIKKEEFIERICETAYGRKAVKVVKSGDWVAYNHFVMFPE